MTRKKEELIWVMLGCLACLVIGIIVIGGYQLAVLMHGGPLVEWWRIIIGGLVFGGMLAVLMIAFIRIASKNDNDKTIQS